jgi:hypothetical protein
VTVMEKYNWELTRSLMFVAIIMAVIVVTRLTAPMHAIPSAQNTRHAPSTPLDTSIPLPDPNPIQPPAKRATPATPPSDPRVFSVGPNEIANRYTLLDVERKPASPSNDQLIVRLHIESLATAPLVSPFESDMLEITVPGLQPINPSTPFKRPLASGSSRNQEVAFRLPAGFRLQDATLRIHYYNYEHEVPLMLDNPRQALAPRYRSASTSSPKAGEVCRRLG